MSESNKSADSTASRSGLYVSGRLMAISPTRYCKVYCGEKDGRKYNIKAHYEATATLLCPEYVAQCVIRFDDEVEGRESYHKVTLPLNTDVQLPIEACGKRTQGVWTLYVKES